MDSGGEKSTDSENLKETTGKQTKNVKTTNKAPFIIVGCCSCALLAFIGLMIAYFVFRLPFLGLFSNDSSVPVPTSIPEDTSTSNSSKTSYPAPQSCEQISFANPGGYNLSGASPGVNENSDIKYYGIYGYTGADLRNEMNTCGPSYEGERYDALTIWMVNWKYNYAYQADGCGIKDITVGVNSVIYMPQWQKPDSFQSGLDSKWQTYSSNLLKHENGHKQNGTDAGNEILSALSNLPAAATCEGMGSNANATGYSIVEKYSARDKQYDYSTNHGATQGAVFP